MVLVCWNWDVSWHKATVSLDPCQLKICHPGWGLGNRIKTGLKCPVWLMLRMLRQHKRSSSVSTVFAETRGERQYAQTVASGQPKLAELAQSASATTTLHWLHGLVVHLQQEVRARG